PGTRGPVLKSRTVSSAPRNGPASASPQRPRRLLVLAEGHSDDPHYGKTGLGVVRYRPESVVAILDSQRAGETVAGFPVVASVEDALGLGPTTALVGVATAAGALPPARRELLKSCIASGLDVESGVHEFLSDDPEPAPRARRHAGE